MYTLVHCSAEQRMVMHLQVNLNIESKAKHSRMAKKQAMGAGGADYRRQKTGHAFSAANPYGKKERADQRQFVRG